MYFFSFQKTHKNIIPGNKYRKDNLREAQTILNKPDKKGFDKKHLIVMALGNIIGSGIFLASSRVINITGPSAVFAYALGGFIMLLEVLFITEMSIINPAPGSFRVHAAEVFGPGMGFVNGWMFWCSGMLGMAGEVTAAAIFSSFWFPKIPQWAFCLFYASIMAVFNFQDARGLSRLESFLAALKILTLTLFVLYGFFVLVGVVPSEMPGKTNFGSWAQILPNGLRGFASSMLLVIFSFTGTGIIGLAVADTNNPERDLPPAVYTITAAVTGLYVLSVFFMVLLLPIKDISILYSPFVQIAQRTGIPLGAALLNIILLTSSLSGLNTAMYSASRMLYSLSKGGQAPVMFQRYNSKGVPIYAVGLSSLFLMFTAFMSYIFPQKIFVILIGASGFTAMFNWLSITVTHLFYRRKTMRECPEKLKFRAPGYPATTFLAIILILLIILTSPLHPDQVPSLAGGLLLAAVLIVLYKLMKSLKLIKQ